MVLVLDCETTGLDPNHDVMLELGMLHVSDDLTRVLGKFSTLVRPTCDIVGLRCVVDPFVREMHEKSGLWDALTEAGTTAPDTRGAEACARDWLDLQVNTHKIDVSNEPMVGSTIGFDRGFLKVGMPALEERFHYRSIDCSSVKELVRRWRPKIYEQLPPARKIHRVEPDCFDTLNELIFYRTQVLDYLSKPYVPIKHDWPVT